MSPSYTSRTLRAIAYLWIAFPVTYIGYAALALDLTMSGIVKMILSPWYWFVSSIAVVAGFGLLKIRWYGWYAFLFSNFTIAYQTAVALAYYSESNFKTVIFLVTFLVQIVLGYIIGREIRVPYFFPRIRWWESDPRYKLSVQAKISQESEREKNLEGEIMDISLTGCFVKTHAYFVPDEVITLDFSLFEKPVQCKGRVVWRTESTVTHPKGIGVKFDTLNKETTLCLKQATQKLKKLARVYSQMTRERNWQEYLQREERYQGKPESGKTKK